MSQASTRSHLPAPESDDPASTPPLADASSLADTPAENTRRSDRRRRETLNGTQPTSARVGLVSEEGDKILDLEAVNNAIANLLVRYHRKVGADMVTKGTT